MKKKFKIIITVIISLIIIISLLIIINNYIEEQKRIERMFEDRQAEDRAKEVIRQRERNIQTFDNIRSHYRSQGSNMTTEMKLENDPKRNYLNQLIGNKFIFYITVNDIKQDNGRRRIFATNDGSETNINRFIETPVSTLHFIIYDDDKIIDNVSVNDKLDIEVIVQNAIHRTLRHASSRGVINTVTKSIVYTVVEERVILYLDVINLEENYGNRGWPRPKRIYSDGRIWY